MKTNNLSMALGIFLRVASIGPLFIALLTGLFTIILFASDKVEEQYDIPINAYISYMDRDNMKAYVDYTYDGKEFTQIEINYYNSSFEIGEQIEVYINSDNPGDAYVKDLLGITRIIILIVCVINVVIFFGLNIIASLINRKRRKLEKLYGLNQITYLRIYNLIDDKSNSFNDEYAKFIVCKLKGPKGEEIVIKSKESFMHISNSIVGQTIGVRLNYMDLNSSKFLIDTIR